MDAWSAENWNPLCAGVFLQMRNILSYSAWKTRACKWSLQLPCFNYLKYMARCNDVTFTVKPVCNDHQSYKIYYMWLIQ